MMFVLKSRKVFASLVSAAWALSSGAALAQQPAPAGGPVVPAAPVVPLNVATPQVAQEAVARAEKQVQTQVEVQENKVSEAEDRVALAKSGRLLRFGVTAGAALAIQTPLDVSDDVNVKTATLTITPYLGVLPAYWTTNEERATFCSVTGLFQDGEQGQRAATAVSRKTATIELEAMLSWLNTAGFLPGNATEAAIKAKLVQIGKAESPYLLEEAGYLAMAARVLALPNGPEKELLRQDVVSVLAARNWRPELKAACGWYRLGLWAGRSFGYSADVSIDGHRAPLDVTPIVSFGALYMPNAYLTVMAGATYNTVVEAAADGSAGLHRPVWTGTFGIGGTLDIASLLAKN